MLLRRSDSLPVIFIVKHETMKKSNSVNCKECIHNVYTENPAVKILNTCVEKDEKKNEEESDINKQIHINNIKNCRRMRDNCIDEVKNKNEENIIIDIHPAIALNSNSKNPFSDTKVNHNKPYEKIIKISHTNENLEAFQNAENHSGGSAYICGYCQKAGCDASLLRKRNQSKSSLKNCFRKPKRTINNKVRNQNGVCDCERRCCADVSSGSDKLNVRCRCKSYGGRGRSKSLGYVPAKNVAPFRRCNSAAAAVGCAEARRQRAAVTLARRYYPEGGWGWTVAAVGALVQALAHGLQLGSAPLATAAATKFVISPLHAHCWLGALSAGVALAISPVTVALCVRKSTRVTAVLGGLVTALGCLFTSFASQFHQLFFSYGTVVGVGVGMTRDCSTLMVAQYFKRRRELVEIFIVSGSGLGISFMSIFIKGAITAVGWRFGLQAVTGVVFLTFILGTFYRSASLYHPQRRAILHLKNQTKIKRKMKDRNKTDDRQPFFDFSTLRSKTVRILLMSTGISAFGINTPIFFLAYQAEEDGLGDTAVLLQTYLGVAWTVGCVAFGLLVLQDSSECRIARQYLCQAAVFVCGLATMALTLVHGSYRGYVMFAWIYGIFCGGYHYSLKMYTYERVRSRNFARTWGFVQCSQAFPIAIGVPLSGYMNVGCGGKAGYYFSSTCSLLGSLSLFCIDIHRRSLAHKNSSKKSKWHECRENGSALGAAEGSNPHRPHQRDVRSHVGGAAAAHTSQGGGRHRSDTGSDSLGSPPGAAPELTCISEEGGLDLDLDMPDNLLDDFDYIGDCITSCNKVENYLMLSEYENNLTAAPNFGERRNRRWSSIAPPELAELTDKHEHTQDNQLEHGNQHKHDLKPPNKPKWKKTSTGQAPNPTRLITVINEASL